MPNKESLILDTHIWIWFMEATGRLSDQTISNINQAAKKRQILIAAISLWEVCMLAEKGRLQLDGNILNWLDNALLHPGVTSCPLTPAIAYESCNLPGTFHGDPADRLIVATARIEGATLITRDENILRYGKTGRLPVLAA